MSVVITVEVNAGELVNALEQSFPLALNEKVSSNMQSVGMIMQNDAQMRAPKRTGYMASQVSFEMLSYSSWSFRLIGRAPYTIYQEFGTRYIEPHLFMTQSIQIHQEDMVKAIQQAVADAITEAFGV
jgi:HK97 gp10 family phage protein